MRTFPRDWGTVSATVVLCATIALAQQEVNPDTRGRQIVGEACTVCHTLSMISQNRKSLSEWEETVSDMMGRGAPLTEGEREIILPYLAKTYGLENPKTDINQASAEQLVTAFGLSRREADTVVRYKQENGTIRGWEDLRKILNLDLKKLEAKRDILAFF